MGLVWAVARTRAAYLHRPSVPVRLADPSWVLFTSTIFAFLALALLAVFSLPPLRTVFGLALFDPPTALKLAGIGASLTSQALLFGEFLRLIEVAHADARLRARFLATQIRVRRHARQALAVAVGLIHAFVPTIAVVAVSVAVALVLEGATLTALITLPLLAFAPAFLFLARGARVILADWPELTTLETTGSADRYEPTRFNVVVAAFILFVLGAALTIAGEMLD